jgi:CMP/dCMP kinase
VILTISGPPGSGKSTVADILKDRLNWPSYYIGGIRREMAKKRGMTLPEYNKLGETDPSTDTEVDDYQKNLGKTEDNFIIQGRTSWYFIPHSLKIYLDVDFEVGVQRIWKHMQTDTTRNEGTYNSIDELREGVKQRMTSDKKRYKEYYNVDAYDKTNYDLIIDTTHKTPEEVVEEILKHVKEQ